MKRLAVVTILIACVSVGHAVTFSAGGGQGTSIVDAAGTGDYTSLQAAAQDFTSYPGGATGPWTLLIRSNLTEPNNSMFSNATNGHAITIKPAPATTPVVTFTTMTRAGTTGTIWDGCMLFGPKSWTGNTTADFVTMSNVIVDGSNNGTTSRDMKLQTFLDVTTTTDINRNIVRIVGDCSNFTVRNLAVESMTSGSQDNNCVEVYARKDAVATNHIPSNISVINCELRAMRGSIGQGVKFTENLDPGVAGTAGVVVQGCDIYSSFRGIYFDGTSGGDCLGNRIQVYAELDGQRVEPIRHSQSNGTTGWTMNIVGNRIEKVSTPDVRGCLNVIIVGGNPSSGSNTVNIVNNFIAGFEYRNTSSAEGTYIWRVIAIEQILAGNTYNIQHNSINWDDLAGFTAANASNRLECVSIWGPSFAGTVNFRNNLVRCMQHNGVVIGSQSGSGPAASATLNFDNNAYYYPAPPPTNPDFRFAQFASIRLNDLAAWKARNVAPILLPDPASTDGIDPATGGGGGAWISGTDLHFSASPVAGFTTTATVPGVTTDIDGDPRGSTVTKGADEFATAAVSDWALY